MRAAQNVRPYPPPYVERANIHRTGRRIYDSLSLYGQGVTGSLYHYVQGDSRPVLLFLAVAALVAVALRRLLVYPSSMVAKFFNQALSGGTP